MNGDRLVDTNIVIALFNEETTVERAFDGARVVSVPSIVLGELYYGAFRSVRVGDNLQRNQDFQRASEVLFTDEQTGIVYGRVKAELRAAGTPLPDNDIWIAALARQHDLTLVTRDAHFDAVNALRTERW